MKKFLKFMLWIIAILILLLALLIFAGPRFYAWMVAPSHKFGDKPIPAAPDYNNREHWAAWPDDNSPAERLPEGFTGTPRSERKAAAFFLHPTTYGGKEHWVQPMDDMETRRDTDGGTISRQASAFNGCCDVYAPRFRQSNIMGYQEEEDVVRIFNTGYEDVRNAFHHFLDEIGPDTPIVLGSHSQGTFQLVRLVMEEVDGTDLVDRTVGIYAIGHMLSEALVKAYDDIDLCRSSTQTGCFISWDAHEADKTPSAWSEGEEEVLWNGTDYTGFESSKQICVNPVTWRTDGEPSNPEDHLGALANFKGFTSIDSPLQPLLVGSVSARCGMDKQSNWLFVNSDRDERLVYQGPWSSFMRNLHGQDFSLFWGNIRQNAIDRTEEWLEKQNALEDDAIFH